MDKKNTRGAVPLHLAVSSGNVAMIQALLEAGASPAYTAIVYWMFGASCVYVDAYGIALHGCLELPVLLGRQLS